MGLLDQVLGGLTQAGGTGAPPSAQHENTLQSVVDLLHSPGVGGIGGLAQLFQSKGLGDLMQGWVGTGPNPAVSPSQVSQVFGPDRIGQFATQAGVPPHEAPGLLAQLLPHVVDHLTPGGQLPQNPSTAGGVMDLLKAKFLGG